MKNKIGIWNLNLETGQKSWTKEVYEIFDCNYDVDLKTFNPLVLFNPTDALCIQEIILNLRNGNISALDSIKDKEFKITTLNGVQKYIEITCKSAVEDKDIHNLIGTIQDISEAKVIEEALIHKNLEVESYLESLNETAKIVRTDPQGMITYVNDLFCSITGYEREEVLGQSILGLLNSNYHPPEFWQELWAVISSGKIWKGEIKNINKKGKEEWIDCTINSIKNKDGKIVEYFSFRYDITEKKKAEQQLQNSYTYLNLVIEAANCGIWDLNVFTKKITFNPKWAELRGLKLDNYSMHLNEWAKYVHPDDLSECITNFSKALDSEFIENIYRFKHSDGNYIYICQRAKVVEYINGKPSKITGIDLDISRHKGFESIIETQKKALNHSSKLVAIGQLASGIGHEINNPLAVLQGNLEMMKKKKSSADSVRIDRMQKSIYRISNIVKGLRTFARSDSDEISSFSVREVIQETVDMVEEIYSKEGTNIEVIEASNCLIKGNRGRLQQVLINLISNAKDSMNNSSNKKIEISLLNEGRFCYLKIKDYGSGISPEVRDKMFDLFFTTKEVNKGTGIGLSLVNNIIKEHGGVIEVESSIGDGTSFIIKLPIEETINDLSCSTNIKTSKNTKNHKILIVEDEIELRELVQTFLELEGFRNIVLAEDGLAALAILEKESFDLILSDLKMPRMNGVDLFHEFKNFNYSGKFIIVSGNSQEYASELQVDGILEKPFQITDLRNLLNKVLG